MKKNKGIAYAVLGIAFLVFNVLAFLIPTIKMSTFWSAYFFTVIAFFMQIGVWKIAFAETTALKSKFLGLPLILVGILYLFVQIIAFALLALFPLTPLWIAIIVCIVILCTAAICLLGTKVGTNEITRAEAKIKKKTFYVKSLQIDIELLAAEENHPDVKTALVKLADKIGFSDPMSNDSLADLETAIADKVNMLKTAENKTEIINELNFLLIERNKKVKLLK